MANDACFVDDKKIFRKAYCGAINQIGTHIATKLTGEKKQAFVQSELWSDFYAYLGPIIDIERTDRDDVFRKSTKFDRPDFGSNIPFELFSALSSLHMSHKQDQDKDDKDAYPHENQEIEHEEHEGDDHVGEGHNPEDFFSKKPEDDVEEKQDEEEEVHDHPHHHDTVVIDEKTTTENPPDSQERKVPSELEVRLQHRKSIEDQVIETKQDMDLIEEREQSKHRAEEAKVEKESQAQSNEDQETQTPKTDLADQ